MSGPSLTSRLAMPARRPHAASRRALASVPARPRARLTSSLPPPRAPNSVRPHHHRRRPTAAAAARTHAERGRERERGRRGSSPQWSRKGASEGDGGRRRRWIFRHPAGVGEETGAPRTYTKFWKRSAGYILKPFVQAVVLASQPPVLMH